MNAQDFARRCLKRATGAPPPFGLPRAPLEVWLAFIEYGLHNYDLHEQNYLVMLGWDFRATWQNSDQADSAWFTFKRRFVRLCRALGYIEPARAEYLLTADQRKAYMDGYRPTDEQKRRIDVLRWYYFPTFVMTNLAGVWTFTLPNEEGEKETILTFESGQWKTHHEYPDVMWQPGGR